MVTQCHDQFSATIKATQICMYGQREGRGENKKRIER